MRMVGNSLKNFFKCLAYIFIPLGCVFLGFLLGVQMLLDALAGQAEYIAQELSSLAEGAGAQADNLIGYVIASLRSLDWSEPMRTLDYLLEGEWLTEHIARFLQLTVDETAALGQEVAAIAADVASELLSDLFSLLLCVILGIVLGYFVTNCFVRRSTVTRGFLGTIVASVTDAVLTATLVAFVTWLLTVSQAGAVVSAIAGVLVFGFISMFEAYLLHARGRLPFRKVVNLRSCLAVYASQIAVLAAATAVAALCVWATGSFVAVALVLSVVIIALLVINVNAESYVDGLVRSTPLALRRIRTYAGFDEVPEFLRERNLLEPTILEKAENKGGTIK